MKLVYTEIIGDLTDPSRVKIIRIFRNKKACMSSDVLWTLAERSLAVREIRKQIWERTEGECEWCAAIITEESMHMHEVLSRGNGGEISLENSVGICSECHIGKSGAHSNRQPKFGGHIEKNNG